MLNPSAPPRTAPSHLSLREPPSPVPACPASSHPLPPLQSGVEVLLFESVAAPLRAAAAAAGAVALRPEGSGTLPALLDALLQSAPAGMSRTVHGAADGGGDRLRADAEALADAAGLAALYVAVEADRTQRAGEPGGPEAVAAAAAAAAAKLAGALGLDPRVGLARED
jgi:hypothetical protein